MFTIYIGYIQFILGTLGTTPNFPSISSQKTSGTTALLSRPVAQHVPMGPASGGNPRSNGKSLGVWPSNNKGSNGLKDLTDLRHIWDIAHVSCGWDEKTLDKFTITSSWLQLLRIHPKKVHRGHQSPRSNQKKRCQKAEGVDDGDRSNEHQCPTKFASPCYAHAMPIPPWIPAILVPAILVPSHSPDDVPRCERESSDRAIKRHRPLWLWWLLSGFKLMSRKWSRRWRTAESTSTVQGENNIKQHQPETVKLWQFTRACAALVQYN